MKQTQNYRPNIITMFHLQFDVVETWQSRLLELTDYCWQNVVAETVLMNVNFQSDQLTSVFGQNVHLTNILFIRLLNIYSIYLVVRLVLRSPRPLE